MSAALRQPMTRDAFLARIQTNIVRALGNRLDGGPCEVFGSDLKNVAAESIRYPDILVTCGPLAGQDRVVTSPVVVFEILSPSIQGIDRIVKNREYRDTPSIQRYVILEQDQQAATVFSRTGDLWAVEVLTGVETISLPEIGATLPLADCYRGVTFPEPEAEPA